MHRLFLVIFVCSEENISEDTVVLIPFHVLCVGCICDDLVFQDTVPKPKV